MKLTQYPVYLTLVIFYCLSSCRPSLDDEVAEAYERLPDKIDFNFHVRPILSDRCFHCHGPDENTRMADLRLDTEEGMFSYIPGKEEFPVVGGSPSKSVLIDRILSDNPETVMPTPESNLKLSPAEKATLIKWVEQGAEFKDHWAYSPPQKAPLPKVSKTEWPLNPIDYFVLSKLEQNGMQPSPRASKETLIRRLTFDLNGLPPSLTEIEDFINDTSPQAYEKLVDRLLASPRYGERWAWEWLDVARYSDTNGFQGDFERDMWPWRDWVIKAFNDNMPYDEFTIKQLAGDLLPNATENDILATGFNRNHTYNAEGGTIPEETRVTNVFDRVETTGTTWLGLTMNCARCHDHKYDNITQKEYYQMFDYFNQTSEKGGQYTGNVKPLLNMSSEEKKNQMAQLEVYIQQLNQKVDEFELKKFPRAKGLPASESEVAKNIKGVDPRILLGSAAGRGNYGLKQLVNYFKTRDRTYTAILKELVDTKDKLGKESKTAVQVMVMDELPEPRSTFILERGGYNKPQMTETICADVPSVLPEVENKNNQNRLSLAQWLVSDEQPLTPRVTVNRYWQAFFGNGIVKTIEDFGVQGALPSHPELLDWLAVDFKENDWDLKKLIKTIVMSATYRQSSIMTEELRELDPENQLLARATRLRYPSWMLRDQALFTSGLMVDSLGGRPVKPYQPEGIWSEATFGKTIYQQDVGEGLYRRSLYTFWRRIVGPTFLFDNASRQVCEVKTLKTNTPLHALTTLNDITYMEAARVLAEKIIINKGPDLDRLTYGFQLVTSRKPKSEELHILQNRLKKLRAEFSENLPEAEKMVSIGDYRTDNTLDLVNYASYTVLSSILFNLDESITRQ